MCDDRYVPRWTLGRVFAEVCGVQLPRLPGSPAGGGALWLQGWLHRSLFCHGAFPRLITHFSRDEVFPGYTQDQIKENGL